MASAAAVGANAAMPGNHNRLGEPASTAEVAGTTFGADDDADDDIVRRKRSARPNGVIPMNEEEDEEAPGDEDDLFGDDADAELQAEAEELVDPKPRTLDDEDLDSGDDVDREDRVADDAPQEEMETREVLLQYPDFGRQPLPEPTDGEMYLLKVPQFLSIEPQVFSTSTFEIPTTDHHSRKKASSTFSSFNTAMSTIRWRKSPSNPEEIQSNARVLRWSDGSLTLQFASDPTQQYSIEGNALAPPQRNSLKPTPTSLKHGQRENASQQTYTYLTMPDESAGLLRVTNRITSGLTVTPSAATTDEALLKLRSSLAAQVQNKNLNSAGMIELLKVEEDPELAKKKAEVAEREKARAQKRREAAENRDRDRSNRALGRAGLGSQRYGAGGLSASMLEDDEMGTTKPRAKPKARRNYNDEYSSDEDLGRRRGNFANDDYEVDDFVAGSDEEEEAAEAESEEEDIDDGIKLAKSPKRNRQEEAASDEDAEGAEDDDVVQAPKAKRRRAVVDEEDEE